MKSERSSKKQHFFSHFKQFQLKMRCKSWICVYLVVRTTQTFLNPHFPSLFSFLHCISKFKTTFSILQRIFSWNCLKCEKKCCFCEERSDFILSQISEFLSDFAQIEVWLSWNNAFSGEAEKKRFWAFWALNMRQIAKMPQKFPWAIMASVGYLMPKMAKILIFHNFSKVCIFSSNIFQNGQNPTESRKSGSFWNLSSDWDFSDFSKMKKTWVMCAWIWQAHATRREKINFFCAKIDFLKSQKIDFYHFWRLCVA